MSNYDFFEELKKPLEYKKVKLNETDYILITIINIQAATYYDVNLFHGNNQKFIGRYPKDFNIFCVKYNGKQLLIYGERYDRATHSVLPTKVYELYDFSEDFAYNLTEEEALETFDPSIPKDTLINRKNKIYRYDAERIRRIKGAS